MSYFYDLPEPKDSFLGAELVQQAKTIASVASRMEEDALTAEVIRVLRGKGYTVTPPGEVWPPSPADGAPTLPECDPERVETVARALWEQPVTPSWRSRRVHGEAGGFYGLSHTDARRLAAAAIAADPSPAEEAVRRLKDKLTGVAQAYSHDAQYEHDAGHTTALDLLGDLGAALASPAPAPQGDPEWDDRYRRGFTCLACRGIGRTFHSDMPDGTGRAQGCLACDGTGVAPAPAPQGEVPVATALAGRDRYAQCNDTCTVDCGACKGAGRPAPAPQDHL